MKKSSELQSELFKAVFDDDEVAIKKLIADGVDPNSVSVTGGTPLKNACSLNRMRAIKALLRDGADPNKKITFHSPVDGRVEKDMVALHYATSHETVTALLEAGADPNATDADGTTVLMRAAFNGHIGVVKALLAAGASPMARQQKRFGKKARTARELTESKIELWEELKNKSRRQEYEEIRSFLLDAEKEGLLTNS